MKSYEKIYNKYADHTPEGILRVKYEEVALNGVYLGDADKVVLKELEEEAIILVNGYNEEFQYNANVTPSGLGSKKEIKNPTPAHWATTILEVIHAYYEAKWNRDQLL